MVYKVVLVDAEEEMRRSLIGRVKWEECGYEVVGEAENGIEALDVIEKTKPDLVMTALKMPFMEGMKLAENIKDRYSLTKVIVISGFDAFAYVQEAMRLGVLRYLLKPITAIEIEVLLKEIKKQLDTDSLSRNSMDRLKKNYEKSLPIVKEYFFNQWVDDYLPMEDIKENSLQFNIDYLEKERIVAIIKPDTLGGHSQDLKAFKNKALMRLAIFNICETTAKAHHLGNLFMKRDEIVMIMPLTEEGRVSGEAKIHLILEQIRLSVEKYLDLTLTIGVGSPCESPSLLYKSYNGAKAALDYMLILGNNKVITIDEIEENEGVPLKLDVHDEQELMTAIKVGKEEKIKKNIHIMLQKLECENLKIGEYQLYILEIVTSMMQLIRSIDIDRRDVFPQEENIFHFITHLQSQEEIETWLTKISIKIARAIATRQTRSHNELIEKAKQYINAHYTDEALSAERVCNELHISTNYFSALFKKETQLTFTSYLTQMRIERAKELLQTTHKKAMDIGKSVGYPEGHYFSYVFKKMTGLAPTEYRSKKHNK